jgi:hypothetical protein
MAASVRASLDSVKTKNLSVGMPVRKVLSTVKNVQEITPLEKASVIFDMAAIRCGFKGDYIATALTASGYAVNEGKVSKWRSAAYTELPTYAHIAALGQDFERAFCQAAREVNGWGRLALLDVVKAIGDLAEEMSA